MFSQPLVAQPNDAAVQDSAPRVIPLSVVTGMPLRVIVTRRIRFKENQAVYGRVVEPVFAFDREVIGPGAEVVGKITSLKPVSRRRRAIAVLGGDLTPLHDPEIEFNTLVFQDGRRIPIQTRVSPGGGAVVRFESARGKKQGKVAAAKKSARDQIEARKREVIAAVKTPGKLQRAGDALLGRLPYHPQSWPNGTRLNAELLTPLDFGTAAFLTANFSHLGTEPGGDSVVYARLMTSLDSRSSTKGMAVEALLSRPLFSPEHQLVFPEGSRLRGTVVQVRPARRWHRNGQLRFGFQNIEPSFTEAGNLTAAGNMRTAWRTEGQLESVEVGGKEKIAMDSEGGTKVAASKTRFIAPLVAVMLAGRGLDRDRALVDGAHTGAIQSNAGGQAVAGAVGFGLIGAGLGQISRPFSAVIGFYGAGWSIYANILGRGQEVKFPAETAIEVRLGPRVGPKP